MAHLREQDSRVDFSLLSFLYPGQRHAAGPAARIDFERQRLQRAVLHAPVPQSDDKGVTPRTTARPCASKRRARLGVQGMSGFLCLSNTNTILMLLSLSLLEETP